MTAAPCEDCDGPAGRYVETHRKPPRRHFCGDCLPPHLWLHAKAVDDDGPCPLDGPETINPGAL